MPVRSDSQIPPDKSWGLVNGAVNVNGPSISGSITGNSSIAFSGGGSIGGAVNVVTGQTYSHAQGYAPFSTPHSQIGAYGAPTVVTVTGGTPTMNIAGHFDSASTYLLCDCGQLVHMYACLATTAIQAFFEYRCFCTRFLQLEGYNDAKQCANYTLRLAPASEKTCVRIEWTGSAPPPGKTTRYEMPSMELSCSPGRDVFGGATDAKMGKAGMWYLLQWLSPMIMPQCAKVCVC
jgi:hypothetical protein